MQQQKSRQAVEQSPTPERSGSDGSKLRWTHIFLAVLTSVLILLVEFMRFRPQRQDVTFFKKPPVKCDLPTGAALRSLPEKKGGPLFCPYCFTGPLRVERKARYCRCPQCEEIVDLGEARDPAMTENLLVG